MATVVGEWQDDAIPAWRNTGSAYSGRGGGGSPMLSGAHVQDVVYNTWDAEPPMADIWQGISAAGLPVSQFSEMGAPAKLQVIYNSTNQLGGEPKTMIDWYQAWLTVVRPSPSLTITEATLPPTVIDEFGNFVDPTVTSVEWEPVSTPTAQRMRVALTGDAIATNPSDLQIHVKSVAGGTSTTPYFPGFQTGPTIAALPDLASFAASDGSVVIDSPPLPLEGDAVFALSLVDGITQSQTWTSFLPGPHVQGGVNILLVFQVTLESAYAPRYRLMHFTPDPEPEPPVLTGEPVSTRRAFTRPRRI